MKKLYTRNKELEEYFQHLGTADLSAMQAAPKTDMKHKELSDQIRFDLYQTHTEGNETGEIDAINVIDNIENTLSKIDDNMEAFVVNFRKREIILEEEISAKDDQIKQLQDRVLRGTKTGGFGDFSAEIEGDLKDHALVKFMQKRLEESLAENKRYQAKYVDMREFAYTSVE